MSLISNVSLVGTAVAMYFFLTSKSNNQRIGGAIAVITFIIFGLNQ